MNFNGRHPCCAHSENIYGYAFVRKYMRMHVYIYIYIYILTVTAAIHVSRRGGGLGSSTIFKKFNEPYAPS